jgi:hypothetical protein
MPYYMTLRRARLSSNAPGKLLRQHKLLRWSQLPTTDRYELLDAMIAAVGIRETARRLCRDRATITMWHRTRSRVPNAVHDWLLLAAANISNARDRRLEKVRWHYPKRDITLFRWLKEARMAERSIEQLAAQHINRAEWEETRDMDDTLQD